jgi:pimeloyl-ACP methyl ester carboxylesterase
MDSSQKIAQTRRGPIEYRVEGKGVPIMVLNGGHCSRRTRLSHERLARNGFLVLTPSRPGYDATPANVGRTAQEAADSFVFLLDYLAIARVDVIGISAAGPTALAFAQRHANRIRRLVLESAVTLPWDARTKLGAKLVFGAAEQITWAAMRRFVRLAPKAAVHTMLLELTTLNVREVVGNLSDDDFAFVTRMIETSQSGSGFLNDIEHEVGGLGDIACPTLAMYSAHDKAVSPENAIRLADAMPKCLTYATQADCHLLWIGKSANEVWDRRLEFLTT